MKKRYRGIFITGTDTGVGKTYIAAGLAEHLRKQGIDVGVMKPAETGCARRNGTLFPSDAAALMRAAGVRDRLDDVNPYRFAKPLAPSVAAGFVRTTIKPKTILSAFSRLGRMHDCMLVEGAGGIMVPLSGSYTYLDLAADLHLPVLIVARPGLGTINHTLLTIEALRSRHVSLFGVVFNFAKHQNIGTAEKTNPEIVRELSGVEIAGVVKYRGNLGQLAGKVSSLLAAQEGADGDR